MNKKLMALAVASALGAPGLAMAQVGGSPGVTLYGRLDSAIMNNKYTAVSNSAGVVQASELKKGDVFAPGNELGVRGREDLGGGTAVWFQIATGIWPDGRLENAGSNGGHFGGRNSGLGVSSAWGDVMFGIWDAPYKVAYGTANSVTSGPYSASGIIMGNGDTTGALPNARCAGALSGTSGSVVTAANGVCVSEVTGGGTQWSRRVNNSVQYWSPEMAGLRFRLATAMANYQSPGNAQFASGLQKPKFLSGNVTWARGPLALAAGWESHQGFRPGTAANQVVNPKDTAIQLGAKWNFGPGEIGVGLETLKYANNAASTATDNGVKLSAQVINGRWNLGPGAIWAGLSKTPGGKSCTAGAAGIVAACGSAGEAKMTAIGYDYVMSKRSKMYFAYAKIDNGGNSTAGSAYYYIAGPAGNNPNNATVNGQGTAGGIIASTDVTTYAFGIQHTF
jgi:predicted porin